jgi:cytochrome-b5 reductase
VAYGVRLALTPKAPYCAYLEEKISDFDQRFYICGPPPFMEAVNAALTHLGAQAESLVIER